VELYSRRRLASDNTVRRATVEKWPIVTQWWELWKNVVKKTYISSIETANSSTMGEL
jgi:hypothetical protein